VGALNKRRRHHLAALAVVVMLAAMAVAPRPAYAHASLVRSSPANNETLRRPPARIVLYFSEAIERRLTQVTVLDKDNQRRDEGGTAFDDRDPTFASVGVKVLAPGLYFVKWSNVSSVDGHNYEGRYPFIVLNPDGTFPAGVSLDTTGGEEGGGQLLPSNLDSALKWIALFSLAIAGGAAFMLVAGIRPGAAFLEDADYNKLTDAAERWVVNIGHVLLPAAFVASGFLVLLTVNRFATNTSLIDYLTTVRTGQYRLAQLLLFAVALAGADVLFLGRTARHRDIGLGVLLAGAAGAMLTYSMVSHSASGAGKFWSVASDFTHLAAAAGWLGALVMLIPLVRWSRREMQGAQRFLLLANVLDRFSIIAGLSVFVILATGAFNGLAEMPNADAMIHTTYGKVLLAKLALLAPLLAVAGLNAYILKPRLVAAIEGAYQEGGKGTAEQRAVWQQRVESLQRLLPRTIIVEVTLIIAVFAAVGVLSQTATAKGEVAQQKAGQAGSAKFNQTAAQGDLSLTLEVSPNRVGLNQYNLTIQKQDGTPSTTVTQARLRFSYDDVQNAIAPSEIILTRFADGDYRGAGAYFTQPGNWRVQTDIRRSDADDVSHQFVLPVGRAVASAKSDRGTAYELPFTVFSWNEAAGFAVVLAGAAIMFYRRQLRWLRQPGYRAGMSLATLLMLGGAVLIFGVHTHSTVANPTAGNPIKPTAASAARGKDLFQQNCIVCHGIDGRGDGPGAASLSPAPTDFRQHMPLHTDPQFQQFIANGYPGSAMPKFQGTFSDEDIWNVVNFMRSAFSEAPAQ
jgi:copper transport protein